MQPNLYSASPIQPELLSLTYLSYLNLYTRASVNRSSIKALLSYLNYSKKRNSTLDGKTYRVSLVDNRRPDIDG